MIKVLIKGNAVCCKVFFIRATTQWKLHSCGCESWVKRLPKGNRTWAISTLSTTASIWTIPPHLHNDDDDDDDDHDDHDDHEPSRTLTLNLTI